jgi:hypothetical protein
MDSMHSRWLSGMKGIAMAAHEPVWIGLLAQTFEFADSR